VTRILLVDDHPLLRRGLRDLLSTAPDIHIVAEAGRSEEVLPALSAHPCDLVLLDLSLPGRGGLEVLKDIRAAVPSVRVLVVSTYAEAQYAVRAMRAGAAGYVNKSSEPETLIDAVRSVMRTGRYVSEAVGAILADFAEHGDRDLAHEQLSDREHQVLRLLTAGKTISEIAAELSLSVKTVSTYRARLVEKLGVRTTTDLVKYSIEHKLFDE
jgi:two-component system, NarL family, invasion response regulator UvrY